MTEMLLDESRVPQARYDHSDQRQRLRNLAGDFARGGSREIDVLGLLDDDPDTYSFQDLEVVRVPFSDRLIYLDEDAEIRRKILATSDLRRMGNTIIPRPYFELMVAEFAKSPLVDDIAKGVPEGKDFVLLSNHDFFFDILLELEALRCAVYDRYGKNERLARLVAQQSGSIVNKSTAWQQIMLPIFGDVPEHQPGADTDFEAHWFTSADVLSLMGSVFYNIPETPSNLSAKLDPKLMRATTDKMIREIIMWRRASHAQGLGTVLVVAPAASVNKDDPDDPYVRNIGAGVPVRALMKNMGKPIESVTEIGTVYNRDTRALSINIGTPHKPDLTKPDTATIRSKQEIARLTNELAAKLGAPIIYRLLDK